MSDKTTYLVGRYENQRFIAEKRGRLDYGQAPDVRDGGIYVPIFVLDNKDRRIMFGWVGGWGKVDMDRDTLIKTGWSGMQTLPRVLTLNSDGLLNFEPAEEINLLRGDHKEFSDIPLVADSSKILEGIQGIQMEVHAVFNPGTSKIFGIEFLDVMENARVYYDVGTKTLCYNQIYVPMELNRKDNVDLRLYIDGKTVEIYANKKVVLTEQLKPLSTRGYRIRLFAQDGKANVIKVDTWKMGTIW